MESQYKVVTDGKLREGVDPEQFVQAFVQRFKVSETQARKVLTAAKPITLKDNLDKSTAEKFKQVLEGQIGLQVRVEAKSSPLSLVLEESDITNKHVSVQETQPVPAKTGPRCPKCGSDRVRGDDCLACGIIISRYHARQKPEAQNERSIYAAPTSVVSVDQHESEHGEFGVRKLAAESGVQWISGGWRHFKRNPFAWIAAVVIYIAILFIADLVPYIGSLATNILSFAFLAGFMLGSGEQDSGRDFTVQHVFAGFSVNFGPLLITGLLYIAIAIVVVIITVLLFLLIGLGPLIQQFQMGDFVGAPDVTMFILLFIIILSLMMVISMAFWFVPALIVFDNIAPIQAITLSFSAFWKNFWAFVIYGLLLLLMAIVAVIPVGLGLLIFVPVLLASIYVSYRNIYYGATSNI